MIECGGTLAAIEQYKKYGQITPCSNCSYFQPFGGGYGRCTQVTGTTVTVKEQDFCSRAKERELKNDAV